MRRDSEFQPDPAEVALRSATTIAVLGIKPELCLDSAAHYIPLYLHQVGYEIIPVPTYFPEVTEIFGHRVIRNLREVSPAPDILSIFRRARDFPAHLADVLALSPRVVWFQSGLLCEESAEVLRAAGMIVIHDCIGCRRAALEPSTAPLSKKSPKK